MQRLPDDIVANILSRLPVKNLLQIKCVSKLWNTTISNPQFAKLQLRQSLSSQENNGNIFKILVLPEDMQPISLDFENCDGDQFGETKLDFPLGYEQSIVTLGYCDGMFCLDYGYEIVIWNPSIRQYRVLPEAIGLPCEGLYLTYGFSFGFDSVADDYKFFRIFRESGKLVLDVFSLKTSCWGRVEYSTSVCPWHQSSNFLHGSLHWLDGSCYPDRYRFFAFGLASEKFLEVPQPDVPGVQFSKMVVFDGCLCVYANNNVSSGIDIWIMKEYMVKDSWTKLGTVLRDTIPNFDNNLRPVCYSRNGDILLEIDEKIVVKYNMKERSCTTVFSVQYEFFAYEYKAKIEALSYVESLVSPNHDDSERPIVDGVLKWKRKA